MNVEVSYLMREDVKQWHGERREDISAAEIRKNPKE